MSMHDGHRKRLKSRFDKEGLDNFEELQVLEMLLFYCFRQGDTNEKAHVLLEHYGSLPAVLEASPGDLKELPGLGEESARYLGFIMSVIRYYQVNQTKVGAILNSIDKCGQYLTPYFCGRRNETVFILCLDAKCKAICCRKVGEGSVNSTAVPIRRIVEIALGANASSVVLAHNHPSGLALPSDEDKQTTMRLAMALSAVEIQLVDHIIVAEDDFVSMAQSGMYRPEDYKAFI